MKSLTTTPTHLQAHFYFSQHIAYRRKNKKELASKRTGTVLTCNDTAMNVNRFYKVLCRLETVVLRGKSTTAANKKINASNMKYHHAHTG